jgi:hypothetical protein
LLNTEELAAKEKVVKDRYDKIIEIENNIDWDVSFQGDLNDYDETADVEDVNSIATEEDE